MLYRNFTFCTCGIFFLNVKRGGLEVKSENEKIPINDLEMAKKRTNKIMITDMAIEKVPLRTVWIIGICLLKEKSLWELLWEMNILLIHV